AARDAAVSDAAA
nr:Chain E, ALA-ALA-ARG-ASP-ALA-ALA-VAL-SER-ASP-ALA-ALA-ALA [synthetic construct]